MTAIAFSTVALVCYVALAFLTICRGVKKKTNQAFMLYLAATAFGQFAALMVSFGNSAESALFWYKLMAAGSGAYFLFHLFFILVFLGVERQHYLFYAGCLVYLCLLVFSGTSLVIEGVSRSEATGLYIPHFGPLTPIVVATPCFLLFYGIYSLIRAYRKTRSDQQRNRIRYLLLGAGIVTMGASTNVSATLRAYPIDIASNVVNACLIAYAILRYQLLEIKVIVRKSLLYSVPTVIIGVFYFSMILLAVHVLHTFAGYQVLIFSLLMAAIAAMFAQPLRNKAQFCIDRFFLREEYDSQSMLQRLSRTAASVLDLDQLTNMILDEITTTIHIRRAAIFLRQEESQELRVTAQKGWSRNVSLRLRKGHPIVDWLSSHPMCPEYV